MEKLKRGLEEIFALDPLSLAPSEPRFFVNVNYKSEATQILIEIGRTFPSIGAQAAREDCRLNLERVRGFLSVDRAGRPAIKGFSSLNEDFFRPLVAATGLDEAFAKALDQSVTLRGLVASPLNGVYAICETRLVDAPIRHLD